MKNTNQIRKIGRIASLMLVLLAFTTVLSGCAFTDLIFGSDETTAVNPSSSPEVTTGSPEVTTGVEVTTQAPDITGSVTGDPQVTTDPASTEPVEPVQTYLDPLTGLYYETDYSVVRPVSIVIDNVSAASPQSGISTADIMIECMVEGGLSRLLLITNKYINNNYTYGPIRSTRNYMVGLSQAFGTLMVGAGYSPTGYEAIQTYKLNYIDGTHDAYARSGFFRSADRYTKSGYEHSLMITANGIKAIAAHYNYSLTERWSEPVFRFVQPVVESSATEVDSSATDSSAIVVIEQAVTSTASDGDAVRTILNYSSLQQIQLVYSKSENAYYRYQYGTKTHYDAENGQQLRFENVLVLFTKQSVIPGDTEGRLSVETTGSGKGYYLVGGEYREITWTRYDFTSKFVFTDKDGNDVELTPGKTFISMMDDTKYGTDSVVLNYQVN